MQGMAAQSRQRSGDGGPPATSAWTVPLSGDDSDSGCDEGDRQGLLRIDALESSILANYPVADCTDDTVSSLFDSGLAKIRAMLLAKHSGATACLICLEKVRVTDPIWDCKTGCHAVFHLLCIQSWAQQALGTAAVHSLGQLSGQHFPMAAAEAEEKARWHCPKCRSEYSKSELPREYRCFCGKQVDPVNDPWLAPHTCGDKCERPLPGDCGHNCVLLCHPGPCPTCPQLLMFSCFCGGASEMRRCGHRSFSCGKLCRKLLGCGKHNCEKSCHQGACPPCAKTAVHPCKCGRTTALRACAELDFRCEQSCGRQLSCQKHWCDKGCHSGSCGECTLAGKRSCPCGKIQHTGITCDYVVPTCGSTCEKPLSCQRHRCNERCHYGPCKDTCRVVLTKSCRCGSLKKEVPCYQDLLCERKCQRTRDCTRHACKRRCCDGNCPPCSEVCGKRLKCRNHKCPAPCHRGFCAPCPLTVQISCACGETAFQVPCGTERDQRPPRCVKPCRIPAVCLHGANCKVHRCHYGACPACQLPCGAILPCGHCCKERCHGPQPRPNPEYTLKSKKKKVRHGTDPTNTGSPCPPCSEWIVQQCLGHHSGSERPMVCSQKSLFQCEKLCGNPLPCGNHQCQSICHLEQLAQTNGVAEVDTCERCNLPCQKERPDGCIHLCSLPCHIGDCPPCKALVKRPCYCRALVHAFECSMFNSATKEAQAKLLPCGGPCHQKLPNCAHLCPDICHPNACPTATNCRKKVVVRCACQRLKKEWLCCEVQAAQKGEAGSKDLPKGTLPPGCGLLLCDQECMRLAAEQKAKEESEALRQRKLKEPEPKEIVVRSKRRRRSALADEKKNSSWFQEWMVTATQWFWRLLWVVIGILLIIYGYKGLQGLSDWMNARDAIRPRKMPGRF
ncbi:unnamed protein product [Sphagnum troendelagicum]|uniref:PHD-type domain-containing protein n=1 Tax=Sphagnum troendelagicum TaxID=128251 RepID=A0ABP0UZ13_9BRYO